jgi:hypothetical protein
MTTVADIKAAWQPGDTYATLRKRMGVSKNVLPGQYFRNAAALADFPLVKTLNRSAYQRIRRTAVKESVIDRWIATTAEKIVPAIKSRPHAGDFLTVRRILAEMLQ